MRVVSLASSVRGQSSYSYDTDSGVGVALSDRFTHHLHGFLAKAPAHATLAHLEAHLRRSRLHSVPALSQAGWHANGTSLPQGLLADRWRVRPFFEQQRAPVLCSGRSSEEGSRRPQRRRRRRARASARSWRASEASALRGLVL